MSGLLLEPRHRVLVAGKTRFGKTTFARELILANRGRFDRIAVFDLDEEYSPKPCKSALKVDVLERAPEALDKKRLLAVRPSGDSAHRLAMDCRNLLKLVRASKGTSLVLLEEPGRYARHICRQCGKKPLAELLEESATSWAKHGIAFVYVTQRAVQVPATVRAQLSTIASFRQDEPADVEALRDRAGKDFAGAVVTLGVGQCRLWRDDAPQPASPLELPT